MSTDNSNSSDSLQRLAETIAARKGASPETSYTAKLFAKGTDTILKKIGEESAELIIAGKGGVRAEIIYETADLFYHTLVLLAAKDIRLDDVLNELARREGVSGIDEKNARTR